MRSNARFILTGLLGSVLVMLRSPALTSPDRAALLSTRRMTTSPPALAFIDTGAVRSGDLIFRRGGSLQSHVVLAAEGGTSSFSHVGIADRASDGIFVIDASPADGEHPGRVVREPIEEFLAPGDADTATAIRVSDSVTAMRAAVNARRYATEAVPFDGDFDLATPNAVYCTELVWRSYEAAGVDVSGGRRDTVHVLTKTYTLILPASLLVRGRPVRAEPLPGGSNRAVTSVAARGRLTKRSGSVYVRSDSHSP